MSAHPMTIYRSGPAFDTKPDARAEVAATTCIANSDRAEMRRAKTKGPVIEMTAHPEDGGHYWGWYPATPDGLIKAGSAYACLRRYGYRRPPVCAIAGQIIPQEQIETAVVIPFCQNEARRRAADLLSAFGTP